MMSSREILITGLMVALATAVLRFLPFLVIRRSWANKTYIRFLGRMIPYSMMGLLVVYCFRNVTPFEKPYGIPELIALIFIIVMHTWRRNVFISIGVGTALYMILVQFVFK